MRKPIHPLRFLSRLQWLDGTPLKVLPYRQKIFSDVLYTFDDGGSLYYSLALLLRAKKNDKSLDGMLAQLYALCTWWPVGNYTGRIVAFDEGQADEDLDLFKKLVRANPVLLDALTIKQKSVERRDGKGFVEIIPGRDVQGQHGGKFDLLVIDEIHTQRDWNLLEALQPDPTRQSLTWITSYNSIYHKPGVPLFDMLRRAWAWSDPHMYFSYYAADRTTDPDFADKTPEERANPSMSSWANKNYLEQQRGRLPSHKFRRLHLDLPGLPEGSAFSAERIDGAIERGVKVRPPVARISYLAFVDMSGGSNDDACLGIAHRESGRSVLDLCINQGGRAPFDPIKAVGSFTDVLKEYRSLAGDRRQVRRRDVQGGIPEKRYQLPGEPFDETRNIRSHRSAAKYRLYGSVGQRGYGITVLRSRLARSQDRSPRWRARRFRKRSCWGDPPGGEQRRQPFCGSDRPTWWHRLGSPPGRDWGNWRAHVRQRRQVEPGHTRAVEL